jgi:hypothetical protein
MKTFEIKSYLILLSDEDFDRVSIFPWHVMLLRGVPYFVHTFGETRNRQKLLLHRFIVGANNGETVDHKNGNTLDNTRENLRICSRAENSRNAKKHIDNRSGYKGVRPHKRSGLYNACIRINGKHKSLGYYKTPEEAHEAYCQAAQIYYGEYARFQ